ncbi:MAG: methylisocitrate lyase [Stellaceae bacterium]
MTWLDHRSQQPPPGERLATLLRAPGILRVPGAHNALAAILAMKAGFKALYLSGAALTASLGLPDLGVLGLDELCFFAKTICRAADLPLIVDADTGYGGILNVMRAVRELEDAGVAAIQIEDQILPKKCGHLNDKRLVAPEEMAAKVTAAVRARHHMRIIARTDAVAVEGIETALERARLYIQAGADIIFPEALTSAGMFSRFAGEISMPLLANMTEFGRTPYFSAEQFESFGVKMVIWPVSSLRIAGRAIADLYQHLAANGDATAMLDRMQTRAELYETIGYTDYEKLDASVARSAVPPDLRNKKLD